MSPGASRDPPEIVIRYATYNPRQYRIKFERVPEGEQAIDPNKLGQRSKLGGEPDWYAR